MLPEDAMGTVKREGRGAIVRGEGEMSEKWSEVCVREEKVVLML